MSRLKILVLVAFALILASTSVQAQKTFQRTISVTISPLHLLLPILEATGEFRTSEDAGMAGILGIGSFEGYGAFELGAQYRYYMVGDFERGMELGAELMYTHLGTDAGTRISASGNGLSFGPFLGYKVAFGFGLTLDFQLGMQWLIATASAEDAQGNSATGSAEQAVLLLNINTGWTF